LKRYLRFIKNFDWIIFVAAILLLVFSVATIYSTTFDLTNRGSEAFQQAMFAILGIIFLIIFANIDYRIFKNFSGVLYIITIIMLISVEFIGTTQYGATRWINIGFFQFQPSELAKVFMILILAKFFSENVSEMSDPRTILKSMVYVGIPTVLVAMQPDLGTALVFLIIWGSMFLVSNAKKIYLFVLATAAAILSPIVYKFFLQDYQRERILTFLNPAADPMNTGWNVNQAIIAIGSGQFWGRGLGHGPQSQLNFVPFKHTDFVFAAIAEEMGFVGALAVILLFAVILYRSIWIAKVSRDYFGMYVATGIFALLFFHVFINIGMNLGIMPVTGIPLPLVSNGGTSVVIMMISLGMLESIIIRYRKLDF
jgi:rod shape determining protein RodA